MIMRILFIFIVSVIFFQGCAEKNYASWQKEKSSWSGGGYYPSPSYTKPIHSAQPKQNNTDGWSEDFDNTAKSNTQNQSKPIKSVVDTTSEW